MINMDNSDWKMKKQVVAEEYLLQIVRSNFVENQSMIEDRIPLGGIIVQIVDMSN